MQAISTSKYSGSHFETPLLRRMGGHQVYDQKYALVVIIIGEMISI